jgi:hypothetical protein
MCIVIVLIPLTLKKNASIQILPIKIIVTLSFRIIKHNIMELEEDSTTSRHQVDQKYLS